MDGARPDTLSDAQLDRELESAFGIEPSPEFLARVRTRVTAEPPFVESGFSRILKRAAEPMWAVAIAGIMIAVVVPQWIRDGKPSVTVTDGRPFERPSISDGPAIERPSIERGMDRVGVRTVVPARPASRIEKGASEPPKVLISQDERLALDALIAAVAENRLPARATPVEVGNSLAIAPLQIQQVSIEPLQLAGLEGVNGS